MYLFLLLQKFSCHCKFFKYPAFQWVLKIDTQPIFFHGMINQGKITLGVWTNWKKENALNTTHVATASISVIKKIVYSGSP